MYICPVCGYEKLPEPPADFSICHCCGTEFEYDDFDRSYAELRSRWIGKGCPWFSPVDAPPKGWNPIRQLNNLLYARRAQSLSRSTSDRPRSVPMSPSGCVFALSA